MTSVFRLKFNNLALFEKTGFVTSWSKECHVMLGMNFRKLFYWDKSYHIFVEPFFWILLRHKNNICILCGGSFKPFNPCLNLPENDATINDASDATICPPRVRWLSYYWCTGLDIIVWPASFFPAAPPKKAKDEGTSGGTENLSSSEQQGKLNNYNSGLKVSD